MINIGLLILTVSLCMVITHASSWVSGPAMHAMAQGQSTSLQKGLNMFVAKTNFNTEETIQVGINIVEVPNIESSAWCGLIPNTITSNEETVNDAADVSYFYMNGGRNELVTSRPGVYNIKCFANDYGGAYLGGLGSEIIVTSIFLYAVPRVYNTGEDIPVYFVAYGAYTPGSGWCGLIPSTITSNDESVNAAAWVWYFWLQDVGPLNLKTSLPGTYNIKCWASHPGGECLAGLNYQITVQQSSSGSAPIFSMETMEQSLLTSIFTVLSLMVMMACIIIICYRCRKNNPSKEKYLEVNVDVDDDFADNNNNV